MSWVRVPTDYLHAPYAGCWPVTSGVFAYRRSINLVKHCVVRVRSKCFLDGLKVRTVGICCYLGTAHDTAGAIKHKFCCKMTVPGAPIR